MDVEETTIAQGAQWRVGEARIGIVRVGEYEGADAAELLLRSSSATEHAIVTVSGAGTDFAGWRISLLSAVRPEDPNRRETVRLRAVKNR